MKALILENINVLKLSEISIPICNNNERLVKVTHCSICKTDAKMWSQGQRDLILPRVLGHEICGKIEGSKDRYVIWPAYKCNKCLYCAVGSDNLCDNISVTGFNVDGGFAEYIKVPEESLIKVPESIPSEIACMTELMGCGINAIEKVNLKPNQNVLIYGGGPAGLLLALACISYGAIPVIIEKNRNKIDLVKQFCEQGNIKISDKTPSNNFEVSINAVPELNVLLDGINKLYKGGIYCIFSGFIKDISVPSNFLNDIHYRQLTLTGTYGCTKTQMESALKIFEKNTSLINLLIQKVIKLEDVVTVLPDILTGKVLKYVVKI